MAKNSKKSKTRSTQTRSSTSVSTLRAERAVAAVTKPFVDWCERETDVDAEEALEMLADVTELAKIYFEITPASDVTSFEPGAFDDSLARLMGGMDPETDENAALLWESIHLFVDFLRGTDAWTGAAADLGTIHATLHDAADDELPDIDVPNLTDAEELIGLAGTVLVQRMEALLRWIGKSKEVTSTGALRLKDIEGAAAAIGLSVRGATRAAKSGQVTLFADTASASVRTVKAMLDEPKLAMFWDVMQTACLTEVGASTAKPTLLARDFLDGKRGARLAVLRDFTTCFLESSVSEGDIRDPVVYQSSMAKIALLLAASSAEPPELAQVHALASPDGGTLLETIVGEAVRDWLDYMSELGLISTDKHVVVQPVIRARVAALMERTEIADDSDDFDSDSDSDEFDDFNDGDDVTIEIIRPAESEAKRLAANIYQLKISLNHASPPIWRRLLVRSNMDLGTLHEVLQDAFDWDGSHLHGFQVGGRGGDVYGALEAKSYGDPDLDEDDFTLGQVLPAEGTSMVYTYDFGDDWEHKIVVEKILPADPNAPTVRCTAGRGMAPLEDSGGVWGWANLVKAANDPTHPDHGHYRDWLRLPDGEAVDPKAFSWKDLNEGLSDAF